MLYFTYMWYPELRSLASSSNKAEQLFWKAVPRRMMHAYIVAGILLVIAFAAFYMLAPSRFYWLGAVLGLLVPVMNMVIMYCFRAEVRRGLRREMVRLGTPICIECAYDLRGLASDVACPECGAPRP